MNCGDLLAMIDGVLADALLNAELCRLSRLDFKLLTILGSSVNVYTIVLTEPTYFIADIGYNRATVWNIVS